MAVGQLLPLPALGNGLSPISGSSAWTFGSWVEASASLSTDIKVTALQFQVSYPAASADALYEFLFEIGTGASSSEVTKVQIPISTKADTIASSASGYYKGGTIFLPEPLVIAQGTRVVVRVTDSIASAITHSGVKIFYEQLPNNYILQTTTGTFTLAGSVIELYNRKLFITAGAFAWVGNNAREFWNHLIKTTSGAFTWTGNDAILTYTGYAHYVLWTSTGAFNLTGNDVKFIRGYRVLSSTGSFIMTGNNAKELWNHKLFSVAGAFNLTGNNVKLLRFLKVLTTTGAFTWTRNNSIELWKHLMFTTPGSFVWTGNNSVELWKHLMKITPGQFTWTRNDAILIWTILGQYLLKTTTGVFTLSGSEILAVGRNIRITPGNFVLGSSGELLTIGHKILTTPGAFTWTREDAILNWIRILKLLTETGEFTLTGLDAIMTIASAIQIYGALWARDRAKHFVTIEDSITMTATGSDHGE